MLESERKRVEAGQELAGMDTTRYNLDPPPPSKRNDVSAWRAAVDNAYAQLEHQYNRLLNLELLLKYGPAAWRAHNEALGSHATRLGAALEATRRDVEATNRERKLQQTAAGAPSAPPPQRGASGRAALSALSAPPAQPPPRGRPEG